eukprot:1154184-Pelagomonas_calceolata.AAC.2
MVATRGAREGTLGAPLVATGRCKTLWGPPLVATCTFLFCTKAHEGKEKQKERASLPKSEAPALGTGARPLLQCPCEGNSSSMQCTPCSSNITSTSSSSSQCTHAAGSAPMQHKEHQLPIPPPPPAMAPAPAAVDSAPAAASMQARAAPASTEKRNNK